MTFTYPSHTTKGCVPLSSDVKPESNEFEIVYAIIDDKYKDSSIGAVLPFFSKVNLMITAQELDRMHFKFSACIVKKLKEQCSSDDKTK